MEALRKDCIQPVPRRSLHDSPQLFRTVTAYEMNATERKKYAPQID
jgi:hypothetical protein